MKTVFSPKEVVKLCGVTYRQIQYWDKTGFIKPSCRRRGLFRLYVLVDLVMVELVVALRKRDISIQRLRKVIKEIRELLRIVDFPLRDAGILVDLKASVMVFSGQLLMNEQTSRNFVFFEVRQLVSKIEKAFPEPKVTISTQSESNSLAD